MNCPQCGEEIQEADRFCRKCGAPLDLGSTGGAQKTAKRPGTAHRLCVVLMIALLTLWVGGVISALLSFSSSGPPSAAGFLGLAVGSAIAGGILLVPAAVLGLLALAVKPKPYPGWPPFEKWGTVTLMAIILFATVRSSLVTKAPHPEVPRGPSVISSTPSSPTAQEQSPRPAATAQVSSGEAKVDSKVVAEARRHLARRYDPGMQEAYFAPKARTWREAADLREYEVYPVVIRSDYGTKTLALVAGIRCYTCIEPDALHLVVDGVPSDIDLDPLRDVNTQAINLDGYQQVTIQSTISPDLAGRIGHAKTVYVTFLSLSGRTEYRLTTSDIRNFAWATAFYMGLNPEGNSRGN